MTALPRTPPPPRPPAPGTPGPGAAVLGLIAVTCLVELVLFAADHGLIGSARWRPMAYQYGGFWAGLLHGWQPNYAAQPVLMFLTHGFLHAGPGHLIGNMMALFGLGPIIIDRFGTRGFLIIYLGSILGGGLGFGLLSHSPAPMVGASGAIFGLLGAWSWGFAHDRRRAGKGLLPVLGLVVVLAVLNAGMWWFLNGLLAWETHLGGFLAGAGLAALLGAAPQAPIPSRPISSATSRGRA